MLVPYSWLKEFINIKIAPEKVGERLSCTTIGVEEIRKEGKDYTLDLEVTYNRGDLLSIIGVARELAALYQLKFHGEETPLAPPSDASRLAIKCAKGTIRYYALTQIGKLSYQNTPQEMRRRLELAGMHPINLFVDITNYVMIEYGQPFHAFDAEKVRARDKTMAIEVRNARRGERITTINGSTHSLSTDDIVIADRKGPIAIAGVMGGKETEIGPETKEILLEAAIFDPISIRKTARRLGLRSEASNRFEHFLSPENLLRALSKAVKLYQLYGKGKVVGFGQAGEAKMETEPVNLDRDKLSDLLGVEIELSDARQYLKRLGFKVMSADKGLLAWPPYWRGDIKIEEDLIEEVARMHGYENLPAISPTSSASDTPPNTFEYFRNYLPQLMAGMGFSEVKSYPFLSTKALTHRGTEGLLRVKNPISAETEYLKDSNILNLLEIARKNSGRFLEGKLFELEKIYPKEGPPRRSRQPKTGERFSLSGIVWGAKEPYRSLKGVLETVLDKVGINAEFAPCTNKLLHPRKATKIVIGKAELGVIGTVHPHLSESFGLKNAAAFELNFEKLVEHAQRWKPFTPISKYPEVYEDFSFYLSQEKALGPLIETIKTADKLIRETALTDLFEREGKRSVTLRITFQSDTGELSSKDLKPVREKITKLIKKAGGKPRS